LYTHEKLGPSELFFSSLTYSEIVITSLGVVLPSQLALMRGELVIAAAVMWLTSRPWHVFGVLVR
jgi:hypothetical protein